MYVQVGNILQNLAPCPDEFVAVALRARTPHSGTFGTVQYTELYGCCLLYTSQGCKLIDLINRPQITIENIAEQDVYKRQPGYMGLVTDQTAIQFRILNRSKGPAMWSPRAQMCIRDRSQCVYQRAGSTLICLRIILKPKIGRAHV